MPALNYIIVEIHVLTLILFVSWFKVFFAMFVCVCVCVRVYLYL